MTSKVRLEKYINFSLISNCIIFNTLAGCKGKNKKGGKGCSGSGKDTEPVNVNNQGQQSAEELAKKQKEQEDKEKADRLAKNEADLNKKRKDLLAKFDKLEPRIGKVNASGYGDLNISLSFQKEHINSADANKLVSIENELNDIEKTIDSTENEIEKRNNALASAKTEFNTTFTKLNFQMTTINNPEKYELKVVNNFVQQNDIDNCKYSQIEEIRTKLTNLENEIRTKFAEIKNKIKEDIKWIDEEIKKHKALLKENPIKEDDLNDCILDDGSKIININIIYEKVTETKKLINLNPKEAKDYLLKLLSEIKDIYYRFKPKSGEDKWSGLEKIIKDNIIDNMPEDERKIIPDILDNVSNIKTDINREIGEFNNKNKGIVEDITADIKNLKIDIANFVKIDYTFKPETIDGIFKSEEPKEEPKYEINIKTKKDDIEYIETKIKQLQDKYNDNTNNFKNDVNKRIKELLDHYDKEQYKLCSIDEDTRILIKSYSTDIRKIKNSDFSNLLTTVIDNIKSEINKLKTKIDIIGSNFGCFSAENNVFKTLLEEFNIDIKIENKIFNNFIKNFNRYVFLCEDYKENTNLDNNIDECFKEISEFELYYSDKCAEAIEKLNDFLCKYKKIFYYENTSFFSGTLDIDTNKIASYEGVNDNKILNKDNNTNFFIEEKEFKKEKGFIYNNITIKNIKKPEESNKKYCEEISKYNIYYTYNNLENIVKFVIDIYNHNLEILKDYITKAEIFESFYVKLLSECKIKNNFNDDIKEYKEKRDKIKKISDFVKEENGKGYTYIFENDYCYDLRRFLEFKIDKKKSLYEFIYSKFDYFKPFITFAFKYKNKIKYKDIGEYENVYVFEIDDCFNDIEEIKKYLENIFTDCKFSTEDDEFSKIFMIGKDGKVTENSYNFRKAEEVLKKLNELLENKSKKK